MRNLLDLCRRFRDDERGAFIAIFGILAIVLIATAGAVVDYTAMEQARTRAQVALDAAALALQSSIYTQDTTWLQNKAQAVVTERVADPRITATVLTVTKDVDKGEIYMTASVQSPTSFVALIGITQMTARIESKVIRGDKNIEVGLALDITQSMSGSKIADLIAAVTDPTTGLIQAVVKDDQDPTYSRMALIPYSNAVNLGTYADSARGPVQNPTTITAAAWYCGTASPLIISGITSNSANATFTTTTNHGLVTGNQVYIHTITGGTRFTIINHVSTLRTITRLSNTTFTIGVSTTSGSGTYTANSGRVYVCNTRSGSVVTRGSTNTTITTPVNHGLVDGDIVYLSGAAGGQYTNLNGREVTVTRVSNTQFRFPLNSSTWTGTYTPNSLVIRKCMITTVGNTCAVQVTSAGHNLQNGEAVRITGVGGMAINTIDPPTVGEYWSVADATADTFVLAATKGYNYGAYTSGGQAGCLTHTRNCNRFWYTNADWGQVLATISNCASERTGAQAYTDAPPDDPDDLVADVYWTGNVYPNIDGGFGTCPGEQFVPLTDDKTLLTNEVAAYTVEGSTAGQIGLAWAWYAISPEFAYMWPTDRGGASFEDEPDLIKIVILMTDGAFNTGYCHGVISQDYGLGAGWGEDDNRINCNATNGDPFDQAEALCIAIKAGSDGVAGNKDDVQLFTVAFDLGSNQDAIDLMAECATDADHAKTADDGAELAAVFQEIGDNISALRVAS